MSGGYENLQSSRPLRSSNSTMFCNFIKHIKLYKIVVLILAMLFVLPIIAHYYISNVSKVKIENHFVIPN